MIEWLSIPTIKDCLYSLLCRLHHDILFNLDVPEQDGNRPISQDKLDEVSEEEFIMKKIIVEIIIASVLAFMGFLSYEHCMEGRYSVAQLQKIERKLENAKGFQAELQAEFPELEIRSKGIEALEAKKAVLEKEVLKDKVEAGFFFTLIYGSFAFMGIAIVNEEMK